jgi:cobalt/nickel transport system permease protein
MMPHLGIILINGLHCSQKFIFFIFYEPLICGSFHLKFRIEIEISLLVVEDVNELHLAGICITFLEKKQQIMFDLIYSEHTTDESFIGKVDPRAKMILFISFVTMVLLIQIYELIPLLTLGISLFLSILLSRFPGIKIVRALIKIYPMILIISIFQILTLKSGEYLHSGIGIIQMTQESWIHVLGFQIKTILIIASGLFLISSTPMKLFLKSFEKLGMPDWIITVTFFVYHFVYILSHELSRLNLAYQSRYIKLPVIKKISIQSRLMAMFFLRIFERNDRLYNALMSRGFTGSISFETTLSWKSSDTILVLTGFTFLFIMQTIV